MKRKIKKQVIIIPIIIIIAIISFIVIKKQINYHNSYEYKFKKIGYSSEEITEILKLENNQIDELLKKDYNKDYIKFIKQKYFIFNNLDRYIDYYKNNKSIKTSTIISMVNVNRDYEYYEQTKKTDISKNNLMLVNKYNYLDETYAPDDIKDISNYYAYDDNSIREETLNAYKEMWNAAKKEDLTLIVSSSYRTYEIQNKLWTRRANANGKASADEYTARAGFSEHQTGLALDILTYNATLNEFENTDEFKWLSEHAHEYGFILRYPKDKEDITGYSYESWHYRYVGIDVATKIKKLNITFDEYYAYFIENNK